MHVTLGTNEEMKMKKLVMLSLTALSLSTAMISVAHAHVAEVSPAPQTATPPPAGGVNPMDTDSQDIEVPSGPNVTNLGQAKSLGYVCQWQWVTQCNPYNGFCVTKYRYICF